MCNDLSVDPVLEDSLAVVGILYSLINNELVIVVDLGGLLVWLPALLPHTYLRAFLSAPSF